MRAIIETDSSAEPSANAEISRVTSVVRRFPAEPNGTSNKLGRQWTISSRMAWSCVCASGPLSSPHWNAGDEAGR